MPYQEMSICALRVSRLTATGAPDSGNAFGAWQQCAGITSMEFDYEIGEGEEFDEVDGCGNPCVERKRPNYVKRAEFTLTMCTVDDGLRDVLGVVELLGAPNSGTGSIVNAAVGCSGAVANNGVAIEWWVEQWDCNQPATIPFRRHVFPRAYLDPQGWTDENGVAQITFEGYVQANSNFGDGPFNDLPGLVGFTDWVYADIPDATSIACTVAGGEYVALP